MEITGYRLKGSDEKTEERAAPSPEKAWDVLRQIHHPNDKRWIRFFFLLVFL